MSDYPNYNPYKDVPVFNKLIIKVDRPKEVKHGSLFIPVEENKASAVWTGVVIAKGDACFSYYKDEKLNLDCRKPQIGERVKFHKNVGTPLAPAAYVKDNDFENDFIMIGEDSILCIVED